MADDSSFATAFHRMTDPSMVEVEDEDFRDKSLCSDRLRANNTTAGGEEER